MSASEARQIILDDDDYEDGILRDDFEDDIAEEEAEELGEEDNYEE